MLQTTARASSSLDLWLSREATRGERAVGIEDALIGGRFLAYARHRLRYFAVRYTADTCVHLVRFLFLYTIFQRSQFYAVVAAYAAAATVESWWWGALEVMRARIRRLYRSDNPTRIPGEIARWLALSVLLAALALGGGCAWVITRLLTAHEHLTAADLYTVSIVFGLAVTLVLRCYHSGIYAIRRVYRPMWAIIAVELAGFALALALWPVLGAWGFPAAMMIATVAGAILIGVYTRRAYTFFGFRPERDVTIRRLPHLRGERREFAGAGLANLVMDMDSYLVLALALLPRGATSLLFPLLFAASPTVRAGVGWARLFYFDFKRFSIDALGTIGRRFERNLRALSLGLGALAWLLVIAIAALVYRGDMTTLLGPLLAFFLSRSLLASMQMAGFGRRAYGRVILSGMLVAAALLIIRLLALDDQSTLLALGGAACIASGLLHLVQRQARGATSQSGMQEPMALSRWLARLMAVRGEVCVSEAMLTVHAGPAPPDVALSAARSERYELVEALASRLRRHGAVTLASPDRVVWYELGTRSRIREDWLLIRSAGIIRSMTHAICHRRGPDAAHAVLAQDPEAPRTLAAPLLSEIVEKFRETFPDGAIHPSGERTDAALRRLPAKTKRVILADALRYSRDFRRSEGRSRFEVTTLCVDGGIERMFLVDKSADRERRAEWSRWIRQMNLTTAVRGCRQ